MKKLMLLLLAATGVLMIAGCQAMSDTAKKVSDDLGDKVTSGFAFVDIWKVTPSDPSTNSAPTGKKVTVIGRIDTIPVVAKDGELVKDYVKYSKTKTPAWYNSDNVTEEEIFVATGDNVKEVTNYFKQKLEKQAAEEAAKAATK